MLSTCPSVHIASHDVTWYSYVSRIFNNSQFSSKQTHILGKATKFDIIKLKHVKDLLSFFWSYAREVLRLEGATTKRLTAFCQSHDLVNLPSLVLPIPQASLIGNIIYYYLAHVLNPCKF